MNVNQTASVSKTTLKYVEDLKLSIQQEKHKSFNS